MSWRRDLAAMSILNITARHSYRLLCYSNSRQAGTWAVKEQPFQIWNASSPRPLELKTG